MSTTYILDGIWGGHTRWERLRRHLEKHLGPARIWTYDNSGRTSLEIVAAELATHLADAGESFNLVGYSMGGLVARETLRQAPALPLHKAALLHSPHGGSLTAHFFRLTACREMRPGSDFLRRLDEHEWTHPTLATWSHGDLVVVPGISGRWHRATRHIQSPVPAHAWPILSRGIHREIAAFLKPT